MNSSEVTVYDSMLEIGIDVNIVDENCQCESGPPSNIVATPEYETTTQIDDCSLYQQWNFDALSLRNINTSDPTTDPCVTDTITTILSTHSETKSSLDINYSSTPGPRGYQIDQKTIIFASIAAALVIGITVLIFCRYVRRLKHTNNNLSSAMTRLTSSYYHIYDELSSIKAMTAASTNSVVSFEGSIKSQYTVVVESSGAQTENYLQYSTANTASNN